MQYYLNQSGSGISHIGSLYISPRIVQQGRGIGSFFAGLYRYLKPMFVSGINAIKNQALDSGKAIINDFGRKPLRNIMEEQGRDAILNLTNKAVNKVSQKFQKGSGKNNIKRKKLKKTRHSKTASKSKRFKKIRKYLKSKQITKDIFS